MWPRRRHATKHFELARYRGAIAMIDREAGNLFAAGNHEMEASHEDLAHAEVNQACPHCEAPPMNSVTLQNNSPSTSDT